MNRSQFFRTAALNYADLVEGGSSLTAAANAAVADAGQPAGDDLVAAEVRDVHRDGSER